MAHLIHIGNSLGVRIPKAMINQLGFNASSDLSLKITEDGLLISVIRKKREGWKEAFMDDSIKNNEVLLMGKQIVNTFDVEEWEW